MAKTRFEKVRDAIRVLQREWYVDGQVIQHTITVDGTKPMPEGRVRKKKEDAFPEDPPLPPMPEEEKVDPVAEREVQLVQEYAEYVESQEAGGRSVSSFDQWKHIWG